MVCEGRLVSSCQLADQTADLYAGQSLRIREETFSSAAIRCNARRCCKDSWPEDRNAVRLVLT